jgi:predicted DNA-binding transcriptional regulator AlpA
MSLTTSHRMLKIAQNRLYNAASMHSEGGVEADMRKRKPRGEEFADYITRRDIAKRLGISLATITRMDAAGEMPKSISFGGVKLYRKQEIEKWIEEIFKPK